MCAHLLQYGNLKPLGDRSVLLLFENRDNFFDDLKVHLAWHVVRYVLDALGGTDDDG